MVIRYGNFDITSKAIVGEGTPEEIITISGIASPETVDLSGEVVLHTAWADGLPRYMQNPVVLLNHNREIVIGKTTSVDPTEKGLSVRCDIYARACDPKIYYAIKSGLLKAFSVGFIRTASTSNDSGVRVTTGADLLEVSIVTLPCNPDAIFALQKSIEYAQGLTEKTVFNCAGKNLDTVADATDEGGSILAEILEVVGAVSDFMDAQKKQDTDEIIKILRR